MTCCYQTSLTLDGGQKGPGGRTLCGRELPEKFGTDEQAGIVAPMAALQDPKSVTCESCAAKLPALREQIEKEFRSWKR